MGVLAITSNCDAALRRFRDQKVPRYLWIDSICIDQSNLLERSEQVELMGEIYRSASQVLIFLSDPPNHILKDFRPLFRAISSKVPFYDHKLKTQFLKLLEYNGSIVFG
jgi:heterokaryon incompatibility protein (HET)